MPRKALSARTRFEIFKRDKFTCQYCGLRPPEAILQVDHIEPVVGGGSDRLSNLITACRLCNLGKSDSAIYFLPQHHTLTLAREEMLDHFSYDLLRELYPTMAGNQDKWAAIRRFAVYLERDELDETMRAVIQIFEGSSADELFARFCENCWREIGVIEDTCQESVQ